MLAVGLGIALLVAWAGATAASSVETGEAVARAARLLAVGAAVGFLGLTVAVWGPARRAGLVAPAADDAFTAALGWALRRTAAIAAVAALIVLMLQAPITGLVGPSHSMAPDRWHETLAPRSEAWLAVTVAAFLLLAVVGPPALRVRSTGAWAMRLLAAGATAALVAAPVLGGTRVPPPGDGGPVAPPIDPLHAVLEVVHIVAMGAWIGGLLALLIGLPAARRALPDEVARTTLTARVLQRFAPVALSAVALLTLAGTGLALLAMTTLYDLIDTAYGRAVLIKVVLLLVTIGIAVLQREYLVPRLERAAEADGASADGAIPVDPVRARRDVRTAMRGEVALLVAVLIVTGALAGYPAPKTLVDQPATAYGTVADGDELALTVEPARAGSVRVTLVASSLERNDPGRGWRVRMRAVPPGRAGSSDTPVDVPIEEAAPGYWEADGVVLGARGTWRFELRIRAAGSPERQLTLPVRIR